MSTGQTQGIQQLLAAERKAAEKINEARKRKAKRLKQAKEEAQQEIEKYRQERDKQFREYEATHLGSREDVAAKIQQDTHSQLGRMQATLDANKGQVIDEVLHLVCDIRPEIHQNLQKNNPKKI